jgi:hypothetical protein
MKESHLKPLRVYLDNMVFCALVRHDLNAGNGAEQAALDQLALKAESGLIAFGASEKNLWEISRTLDHSKLSKLVRHWLNFDMPEKEHREGDYQTVADQLGGYTTYPITPATVEQAIWARIRAIGIDHKDTGHLLAARRDGYDVFLTTDGKICPNKTEIEAALGAGIEIMTPTELMQRFESGMLTY